ncbi:hypothetical protein F53441_14620 [Fusarium austroafricanum]|uniref:Uncharacterized protein n=1 Tax=Fusarium austroafricanum TaxID=2364996 RepID=A0A8H4NI73_9HYPO|nr:hypothetical protein F53441_14620 [Fusarium austroafricanum]
MSRTPTNGFDPSWADDLFPSTSQSSRMEFIHQDTQNTTSGFASLFTGSWSYDKHQTHTGDLVSSRGFVPPPNSPAEGELHFFNEPASSLFSAFASSRSRRNALGNIYDTPTSTAECSNGDSTSAFSTPPEPNLPVKDSRKSGWTGEYSDPEDYVLVSTLSESDSKNGGAGERPRWTGEYSDPGPQTEVKNKGKQPFWTGESSIYAFEPEPSPVELNAAEKRRWSWFQGDEEEYWGSAESTSEKEGSVGRSSSRRTLRSLMASLPIRSVRSGTVSITEGQAVALYSSSQAGSIKEEKPSLIGRVLRRAGAIRIKRRKKDSEPPKREPNHANLSPDKSCLKPAPPMHGTVDRIDDLEITPVAEEKTTGSPKTVSFDSAEPRSSKCQKTRSWDIFRKADREQKDEFQALLEDIEDEDTPYEEDSSTEFASQDEEIERRIQRASDICTSNERASILRGSLDFYLVVCDRVDSTASSRIEVILQRLGPRSIGSYVGEEKDFTKGCYCGNKVPEHLYRSKETAMSWTRRRQSRSVIRLSSAWERDLW